MPDFEISRTPINGGDYVVPGVQWGKVGGTPRPDDERESSTAE